MVLSFVRLVEVGGLKAVLPVFMGRGAARKLRQKVTFTVEDAAPGIALM